MVTVLLVGLLWAAVATRAEGGDIIPLSYDLVTRFPADVAAIESFSASLTLHFFLEHNTSLITLDAVDLQAFRNVTVRRLDGQEVSLRGIRIRREAIELKFDELMVGEYILAIGEYAGRVSDGSAGVFRRGGMVITHLQPSFARRLLPCVDRPSVRAPFRVTVEHAVGTSAFSNTMSLDERATEGGKRTIFAVTPSLPSYLIAFSIVPDSFYQVSAVTSFGVTIRVMGDRRSSVLRVLRAALEAFELLESIVQLPLPLNKMDFLLVPSYEGGMENWGHIVLSSTLAEAADDAHLLHLVSHELAHHWVGNAATVSTWAHICLQEDLTELLAHKVLRRLLSKADFERFRLAKYIEIQLAEDVVSPSHSLLLPDTITPQMIWTHCYLKGVILLEAIEEVVREEFLLEVIRDIVTGRSIFELQSFTNYLQNFTVEENVTLAEVYEHWYKTGGYPSIAVSESSYSVHIKQTGPLWPLRLSLSDNTTRWQLSQSTSFMKKDRESPILVNTNFANFLRVNYDNRTWNAILDILDMDPKTFSPVTRAQFISDLCYFSPNADPRLVQRAMAVVYRQPQHFDLCDWCLLWCRHSLELTASSLLQRAVVNLSSLFSSVSDYSCRSGEAILTVNRLCQIVFGKTCI